MKTGTSGSVTSITSADVTSMATTQARTATGTTRARTTCGRNRPKYASSGPMPCVARVAISALSTPSRATGSCRSRFSTSSRRSWDKTPVAARRPASSNAHANAPRPAKRSARSASSVETASSEAPSERAGDHPGEQGRLEEHEDRRRDAERDVGSQQPARCLGATEQARIQRAQRANAKIVGLGGAR